MPFIYTPPPYAKRPDRVTLKECRRLLAKASERWNVPPAHIISHIRSGGAAEARKWLMLEMLALGLKRNQIAWAFGLDLRRVRRREIGGPASAHGKPGGDRYRKVDLLGYPLVAEVEVKRERPHYRERFMEALGVLKLVARESEVAMRWVRMFEG